MQLHQMFYFLVGWWVHPFQLQEYQWMWREAKTAILLQKPLFTTFLSRLSQKPQHTCFTDIAQDLPCHNQLKIYGTQIIIILFKLLIIN